MNFTITLTGRQKLILQAAIEEFIATGIPVSSAHITEKYDVSASSATVRNEMSLLEEYGLLCQPHTSAGRVPTDEGYKYYSNQLLDIYLDKISKIPVRQVDSSDIKQITKLLGELTHYAAFSVITEKGPKILEHIELSNIGSHQILVVIITTDGDVLHSLSKVSFTLDSAKLKKIGNLLNEVFQNRVINSVTGEEISLALMKIPSLTDKFISEAPALFASGFNNNEADKPKVYMEGTQNLFQQTDFSDVTSLKHLMQALNEDSIFNSFFEKSNVGSITFSIGGDNSHTALSNCAIVFTSYNVSNNAIGNVGVLGPKRMEYKKVINHFANFLNNLDNENNEQ